ncbi:YXWGXW repeat-containing protein, partial [bacterium]|nr:YXWGXW repeat-containing protein [bacterium]
MRYINSIVALFLLLGTGCVVTMRVREAAPPPVVDPYAEELEDEWERPPAPGPNYLWVDAYALSDGFFAPGYWKLRNRIGFSWESGFINVEGLYIPGYWKPLKRRRPGYNWVPGYRFGGRWYDGKWRRSKRAGYAWMPGHWTRLGTWTHGYWRPMRHYPRGKVWVPGHWNRRGNWVAGRWRLKSRVNHDWIKGRYNIRNEWVSGHWKRIPENRIWVPGYWDRRGVWVKGLWRQKEKSGYKRRSGRYNRFGAWVPGRWVKEDGKPARRKIHKPRKIRKPKMTPLERRIHELREYKKQGSKEIGEEPRSKKKKAYKDREIYKKKTREKTGRGYKTDKSGYRSKKQEAPGYQKTRVKKKTSPGKKYYKKGRKLKVKDESEE